jgi:hypothetical protein
MQKLNQIFFLYFYILATNAENRNTSCCRYLGSNKNEKFLVLIFFVANNKKLTDAGNRITSRNCLINPVSLFSVLKPINQRKEWQNE